jgi:hypothetical protein
MAMWSPFAHYGEPPQIWSPFVASRRMQLHLDRQIACRAVDEDASVRLWDELLNR